MICSHCGAKAQDLPFCPHCGYRLDKAAEYSSPEHDPQGKLDRRARRRRFLRRWGFPFLILLVIVAFGVLGLALVGFRDGMRDHDLATRHQAEIHYNRGEVYLEAGWYQMAEAEFEETLRLAPGHTEAAEGRRIAQIRQTVTPSPTPSPSPSPTVTPTIPTPTPEVVVIPVAEVLFKEGLAHYEAQEWEQAISKLEQLRSEDATYESGQVTEMLFHSYDNRGMELDEKDMVEAAITHYDRALDLVPRHPEVEERRRQADLYQSALYFWNVDWERVILNLTSLYARAPDYKDTADRLYGACVKHAQTFVKRERHCVAAELYEQAIEIRDDDPEIVEWEYKTRRLCETTTPVPLGTPTINGPWFRQGEVHLGTLVGTCYNPRADQYDICAQDAEDNVLSTWITHTEQPALTLDGRMLAYRSTDPERVGLYAMDIISGTVLTITTESEAHHPTWSPDGIRLAYTQYDEESADWFIYIGQVGSSDLPRRVHQGEWPSWGPSGLLAFTACNGENDCGIYVYDPISGQLRTLTQSRQDRVGAWSPSGDEIAYTSDIGLSFNLYVVNVDSGFVRQITKNLFTDVLPVWSPDGQRIGFITDRHDDWTLYTVHPWGGQEERIASLAAESADWRRSQLAWTAAVIRFPSAH